MDRGHTGISRRIFRPWSRHVQPRRCHCRRYHRQRHLFILAGIQGRAGRGRALRQLLPQIVQALRDGSIVEMLASDLVPGDIVLLEEGNFIPADCRLIEAFGLRVNTATVTGESLPLARNTEPSAEDSPLYAKNVMLAGTSVVSGQARAVVYATGMHTEFGRIAQLTQTAGVTSSPLQREIARLSRIVAALASGMGVVLFFIGQAIGLPIWENLLFSIGIIVANVPEGLLPTVTLSLAMAT